jgi:hypothetical protein
MSIAFLSGSRFTLAALAMSVGLVGTPALAGPPRAKPARAIAKSKIERKVVKIGKAHIETATAVKKATAKGGTSPSGQGAVQHDEPDEIAFTLSANTPNIPYRGRLIGHYPREWRTEGDSLGPGGEIWLSQNQVPNLSYVIAQIHVEPGHDYEVTLCTGGGTGEMVRATVGDVTHTFKSGNDDCDMTLVLEPEETGKTNIKIAFADEPREHSANAFSVVAVEVVRR